MKKPRNTPKVRKGHEFRFKGDKKAFYLLKVRIMALTDFRTESHNSLTLCRRVEIGAYMRGIYPVVIFPQGHGPFPLSSPTLGLQSYAQRQHYHPHLQEATNVEYTLADRQGAQR